MAATTSDGPPSCGQIRAALENYLDGALPAQERIRFITHLSSCQSCASGLAIDLAVHRAVAELRGSPTMPEELQRRLLAVFERWRDEHGRQAQP